MEQEIAHNINGFPTMDFPEGIRSLQVVFFRIGCQPMGYGLDYGAIS
jgi:hypothetical protein